MIKQVKAVTWLAGAIFALTGIFAGEALAGISATKHNLSTGGQTAGNTIYSTDNPEICIFCHTPHAATKNGDIPLWNHALSTVASGGYTLYTSPTMDGVAQDLGGVDGTNAKVSNLCLSCHDGTVAINSVVNASNANPTITMTGVDAGTGGIPAGNTNLGTDLSDDHPVNFAWPAGDTGLNPVAGLTGVRLYTNTVQCASCHDPHTSEPTTQPFLRVTMNQSQLCTTCHAK